MPNKTSRLAVAGAATLALVLSACGGSDKGSDDVIKVGAPINLSGALAATGKDALAGAKLAVAELNESGGVLGRKVKLIVRDNQSKPEVAVEASRKLVEEEGVVALLAPASSAEALAVSSSVSGPMQIPLFTHSANSDAVTVKSFQKYVFALGPNSLMESKAQAKVLAELPAKRWGLLAADYEGGHANIDAFKRYIKEYKPDVEFVTELYPPLGSTDYTPYVNKMLAAEPDYVFSVLFGGDLIAFSKQAKDLQFFGKVPFTSLYDSTTLKALGGDAPVGARGYGRAPFFALTSPAAKEFTDAFRKANNSYPADWSYLGYDAINVWAAGVEKAGTTDADPLVAALEKGAFKSTRGDLSFRSLDHQANAPEYYYTITESDPTYGFSIGKDAQEIPGADILLSEDEITTLRKK